MIETVVVHSVEAAALNSFKYELASSLTNVRTVRVKEVILPNLNGVLSQSFLTVSIKINGNYLDNRMYFSDGRPSVACVVKAEDTASTGSFKADMLVSHPCHLLFGQIRDVEVSVYGEDGAIFDFGDVPGAGRQVVLILEVYSDLGETLKSGNGMQAY